MARPSETTKHLHVLIAGGGIGGLCAGLCLHHHGHAVTVLEAAPELGEVGAGIQLSPNAMRVFRALDLEDALIARSFRPEAIEARMGESGRRLFRAPLDGTALTRWDAPYLHIHRADLIAVLRDALAERAPDAVQLDAAIAGYAQDTGGVSARLSDGATRRGNVLIGADGIHSVVSEKMLGPIAPRFTGNVAWRAVVPVKRLGPHAPDPTACVWMGRGRHAVTYRLRGGDLANLVGVVERDDWTTESWTQEGAREDALADFKGWHLTVTTLLEQADTLHRWALFDRAPLPRWTDGRVALLGDAAHAMLPFMAQGAAMAVEDGWVLAKSLSGAVDVPSALQRYEHQRLPRTTRMQRASRANMKTFHKRSRLSQLATYGPMWMAGRIAPGIIHTRQDWIYGHDVTAG